MKRPLVGLLAALLLLAGCAAPAQPRDLQMVYTAMEKAAVLPAMVVVPEGLVPDFYGIEPGWYEQALFMVSADSLLADEVVLIRARDQAAAKDILGMLEARMQAKAEEAQTYSPKQYAIIKQGQLLSSGLELALIVSPDAPKLVQIYQGK